MPSAQSLRDWECGRKAHIRKSGSVRGLQRDLFRRAGPQNASPYHFHFPGPFRGNLSSDTVAVLVRSKGRAAKSSYMQVDINESLSAIFARLSGQESEVTLEHMRLLNERYDLSDRLNQQPLGARGDLFP